MAIHPHLLTGTNQRFHDNSDWLQFRTTIRNHFQIVTNPAQGQDIFIEIFMAGISNDIQAKGEERDDLIQGGETVGGLIV